MLIQWLRAVLEIVYVFMYSYILRRQTENTTSDTQDTSLISFLKNPNTEHESYFSLIKINHDFIIAKVQ